MGNQESKNSSTASFFSSFAFDDSTPVYQLPRATLRFAVRSSPPPPPPPAKSHTSFLTALPFAAQEFSCLLYTTATGLNGDGAGLTEEMLNNARLVRCIR
jgi:hypothetical protein